MNVIFFTYTYCHLYLSLKLYVYYLFYKKKNCILEFLRVCSKRSWFLFSMKGAPLGFWQEKTWIVG